MKRTSIVVIISIIILLVVSSQTLFVVHQTQTAIVLQLGEPMRTITEPGLNVKLPFIQDAILFDSRILGSEARTAGTYTKDKKAIVLDHYTRWRVINPLKFYQSVRNITTAQSRLDNIVESQLKASIGKYTLTDVVSGKRGEIISTVTQQTSRRASEIGIAVLDVRIKRTDLPPQNQQAIFDRMQTERERQAKQYRSEGEEEAAKIRSSADKKREVTLAEAKQQAEIIRGEGDAKAIKIYADAINQSPDFYEFSKSLEVYKNSLPNNTRLILPLNAPLLKYLNGN